MRAKGLVKASLSARISRVTRGDGPDYFELSVTDETSGLLVTVMNLDDQQFANLLSSRQAVSKGEINVSGNLGKKHEHKTVQMPYTRAFGDESSFSTIFDKAEVENAGWRADRETFNNYRYSFKDQTYNVTLRRWVEVDNG